MPNTHATLGSLFTDIADAIRGKDGTTVPIVADTFPSRITAIPAGDTSDATAVASDIKSNKTAYARGQKLVGTMQTRVLPNPVIGITSATGLVAATVTLAHDGYIAADSSSSVLQLDTEAGATITPTESSQTAITAGKYATGTISVAGITPTYVGSGVDRRDATDVTVDNGGLVTIPAGYYSQNVTSQVKGAALVPVTANFQAGYMSGSSAQGQIWHYEAPDLCYSDVYEITAGPRFYLSCTAHPGTRFRAGFFTTDIRTLGPGETATGEYIVQVSDPGAYRNVVWQSTVNVGVDGYLVVQKDNAGNANVTVVVYNCDS